MDNIFIGWSGNQSLANCLATEINGNKRYKAVVGGGKPTNMFIGEQVLTQINDCEYAILLVEKKPEGISGNLMFEWGYLVAKLTSKKICTVLINCSSSELPTDVVGSWVLEMKLNREEMSEEEFAKEIASKFTEVYQNDADTDFFSIISDWENCFFRIRNNAFVSDNELCRYIIMGCLAAYYYDDNEDLRNVVSKLVCTEEMRDVIHFAMVYIDVFLYSENMMKPLTDEQMYNTKDAFETLLARERKLTPQMDAILDMLCHDAYGLACALYLRDVTLDEESKAYFEELAKQNLLAVLDKVDEFKGVTEKNECFIQLIKGYIYNDLSRFYERIGDLEQHISYLEKSVNERRKLFNSVRTTYPHNSFLIKKVEQEYTIALSAQCRYMTNPIEKKMCIGKIKKRVEEWSKDYRSLSSLITRIEVNLALIEK